MYARVNIIFGRKTKVEDGVSHLEESDRAAVEATDGNLGLTTLVDREAGVIMAVSYWDEPTHSSEAALSPFQPGSAGVDEYEDGLDEVRRAVRAAAELS